MVERLKLAISRARERRNAGGNEAATVAERPGAAPAAAPTDADRLWDRLEEHHIDPNVLARERIVTHGKTDPSYTAFDMLRTRLIKTAISQGKRHIGMVSPTKGCGKTVVSANLALSFARNPQTSVILADFDMRSPRLSRILGLPDRRSIRWLLDGSAAPDDYLLRGGEQLALALNSEVIHDSAELLQRRETAQAIAEMDRMFAPDLVLYDLPPLLIGDEAMSFLPRLDAVLMIIAAGHTRADQIEECEEMLGDESKLLGILLNKAAPDTISNYYYSYGYGYGMD